MDEDYQKYLSKTGISKKRVRELYTKLSDQNYRVGKLSGMEKASMIFLVDKQLQEPGRVQVLTFPETITREMFNRHDGVVVSFTILGPDWAGLLDGCSGILHSSNMNITYTRGFVVHFDEFRFGLTFFEVSPETVEELHYLMNSREEIVNKLSKVAMKDQAITHLHQESAMRLALFIVITDFIRENYPRENLDAILGEYGEALKFFEARSEQYIRERKVEDIARLIVNNHNFARAVREDMDRLMVDVRNIEFGEDGELTGITLAAALDRLSLGDCFRILEQVEPGFKRKHDKGFFTSDNIGVFRLEICTKDNNPLSEKKIEELTRRLLEAGKDKTGVRLAPGVEFIRRKIVPGMVEEERQLKIPQVYIHPHSDSHIKIVLVSSGEYSGYALAVASCLNHQPGFTSVAAETPSTVIYEDDSEQEVVILDLWVDSREFFGDRRDFNVEDIFDRIDALLMDVPQIGTMLRLFDNTSKVLRRRRFDMVMGCFEDKDYSREHVQQIFARLGDKYILNSAVQPEEVAAVISLGLEMLYNVPEASDGWVCRLQEIGYGGVPPYPWIGIACPVEKTLASRISKLQAEFGIKTYTTVVFKQVMVFLVKLSRGGLVGKPEKKEELMETITRIMREIGRENGWQGN